MHTVQFDPAGSRPDGCNTGKKRKPEGIVFLVRSSNMLKKIGIGSVPVVEDRPS